MSVSRYSKDSDNNMDLLDDGVYVYYLDYKYLEDKYNTSLEHIKGLNKMIEGLEDLLDI